MQCNLCDSLDLKITLQGNIDISKLKRFSQYEFYGDIYKCQSCGFVAQKLEHDVETVIDKLQNEVYLDEEIGKLNIAEKYFQFDSLVKIMKKYCQLSNIKLLDAGANTGVFLNRIKNPTIVTHGIEPSKEAAKTAKKLFDIPVENAVIADSKIDDNTFDVITMWDVIEHLYDPKKDLSFLHDKLKVGGKIFISTHNIDDLCVKLMGPKYPLYMYQHFFHFSKRTLRMMLEKVGFQFLGVHSFCKSWTLGYIYQLMEKESLTPGKSLFKKIAKPLLTNKYLRSKYILLPVPHFFVIVATRIK
jgi:2-polyprenyl-3-methyl-5-hydroxy-6-metoxy-1,4-benzoquinol methylase